MVSTPLRPIPAEQLAEAERLVRGGRGPVAVARHFGWDRRTTHRVVDAIRQRIALEKHKADLRRFAYHALSERHGA